MYGWSVSQLGIHVQVEFLHAVVDADLEHRLVQVHPDQGCVASPER